jgi:UDP-GlcNAc:undecaprenyl-phosphate GlcNAc-1-phosphate transferase
METFAAILIVPWLLSLAFTPVVIGWAHRRGWLDHPTERKRHAKPIPILGGVAVFGSAAFGLLLLAPFVPQIRDGAFGPASLSALGVGAAAMVAIGLWDDLRNLPPMGKLALQTAVAVLTWALGFRVAELGLVFDETGISGPVGSLLLTIGWIVVVSNAFNLIDGLDGLASGISIICLLTVFLLANGNGATVPVIGALALAGSLAAFLRFNLPPARVFLGDAGSLAIGYTTAVLSLASSQKAPAGVTLIVPLVVIGVPMLDTALAIVRRAIAQLLGGERGAFHPLALARAVFRADRGHIHHLLVRFGLTVPQSLAVLYAISGALAVLGYHTRELPKPAIWALWLSLLAVGYAALRALERRVLRLEAERDRANRVRAAEPGQTRRRAAG